jgi:hypothetical protein
MSQQLARAGRGKPPTLGLNVVARAVSVLSGIDIGRHAPVAGLGKLGYRLVTSAAGFAIVPRRPREPELETVP